ncbi:D-Tyr tRNAtyr deacylase-like domain-containing protein [Pisolithus croceorrhizus]|nr:D-Tyr tRNAtyr deacylase-like domain-containing protein [Pisolithus croceorrhizus]KAI6132058.1 D-Tyr tRNAtyr deacylase-like domain-containing protein [Pisolithus croceorrhizus]
MRAVVQRVAFASVTVDGNTISSISKGLMVLVGIGSEDTPVDIDILSNKILGLRVFPDANGTMWKNSIKDISGEVLCVSQFTLMANTSKGNKPDFHRAMSSESSRQLYSAFLSKMRQLYVADRIQDGQFGAMMDVTLTNEGPVTFTLDTRKFEYVTPSTDNGDRKVGKSSKTGKSTLTPDDPEIASEP